MCHRSDHWRVATKQKRTEHVPLSGTAIALLSTLHTEADPDSPYVFPGNVPKSPLSDIKRFWHDVRRAARCGVSACAVLSCRLRREGRGGFSASRASGDRWEAFRPPAGFLRSLGGILFSNLASVRSYRGKLFSVISERRQLFTRL